MVRAIRPHDLVEPLASGGPDGFRQRAFEQLEPLTDEQLAVVRSPARARLAVGHPGTGKTGALLYSVVEELRSVRTQLLVRWFNPGAGRRTLAVTSPCAREGRSFVAANLAVVFSQLGQRTLLVDADFRSPRQQSIFNVPDRFGLSSALSGRADLSVALPVTGLTGLSVLPAGPVPPNPLELLSRASFAALLAKAQLEYDTVIIDTPAASEYADAPCIDASFFSLMNR